MGMETSLNYRRAVSSLVTLLFEAPFIFVLVLLAGCSVPAGKVRVPEPTAESLTQTGIASWYGPGFHGKATASGDTYDQNDFTAAHQTLPLGTRVRVTNLENGSATEVSINDRGPFAKSRIIDLSYSAAQQINMVGPGTALVRVDVLESPIKLQKIRDALDYTLQLGSFTQLENAQQLRDRVGEILRRCDHRAVAIERPHLLSSAFGHLSEPDRRRKAGPSSHPSRLCGHHHGEIGG